MLNDKELDTVSTEVFQTLVEFHPWISKCGDITTTRDLATGALKIYLSIAMKTNTIFRKKYGHPYSWWDAFKIRFFPDFLLSVFPPKYKYVTLSIKKCIPTSDRKNALYSLSYYTDTVDICRNN